MNITITPIQSPVAGKRCFLKIEGASYRELVFGKILTEPKKSCSFVLITYQSKPAIWFLPKDSGIYFVSVSVIKTNTNKLACGSTYFNVLLPERKPFVSVVYETALRTPEQALVLDGIQNFLITENNNDRYVDWKFTDIDRRTSYNRSPNWLIPYLNEIAVKNISLPAVVVGFKDDKEHITAAFNLPIAFGDPGPALNEIKKHLYQL